MTIRMLCIQAWQSPARYWSTLTTLGKAQDTRSGLRASQHGRGWRRRRCGGGKQGHGWVMVTGMQLRWLVKW